MVPAEPEPPTAASGEQAPSTPHSDERWTQLAQLIPGLNSRDDAQHPEASLHDVGLHMQVRA